MPENKTHKRLQNEAIAPALEKFLALGFLRDVSELKQDPKKYMELSYKYHKLWLNFCYKNGKRLAELSTQMRLKGASSIRAAEEAQDLLKKEFEQELLSKVKKQSFDEIWQQEQTLVTTSGKYLRPIYNHHALISLPAEPQKKAKNKALKNKILRILKNIEQYRQERLQKKKETLLALRERVINQGQRSFRLAALMVPLAGLGYSGYLRTANAQVLVDEPSQENKNISEKPTVLKQQTKTTVLTIKKQEPKVALLEKTPVKETKTDLVEPDSVTKPDVNLILPEFSFEDISAFIEQEVLKPDTEYSDISKYEESVLLQKDKDMAEFCAQYKQCAHDNYIKLECGNKRKAFKEANEALRHYGFAKISQGLHCAGMSMASLCQAADIFIEKHPQSPVSMAIKDILKNCNNVHSCVTLKNDLANMSGAVKYSQNIEADIKQYMQDQKNAIVFVWTKRTKKKYHHQTFFAASEGSSQAYIYCAYNNQHWGDEETFSRYMRSRKRYGSGAYFTDISQSINQLALNYVKRDIALYKENKRAEHDKLWTCAAEFDKTAAFIRQSIFTR